MGFTKNGVNGLRIKVLTSKADPQMDGIFQLRIFRVMKRKTKGLKILKIKKDGLLLCLANPYRNGDPEKKEPGPDSTKKKTMSIPLNF